MAPVKGPPSTIKQLVDKAKNVKENPNNYPVKAWANSALKLFEQVRNALLFPFAGSYPNGLSRFSDVFH